METFAKHGAGDWHPRWMHPDSPYGRGADDMFGTRDTQRESRHRSTGPGEASRGGKGRPAGEPMVFVIDGDADVRLSLESLFGSVRLRSRSFESPMEFLRGPPPDVPSCLVLDVRLPGESGLEFQARLARDGVRIPIVFVTGHGDISMTVQAMKAGAVDFLTKPWRDQDLLDAVMAAINADRRRRAALGRLATLRQLFLTVTQRERQIMALVTAGLLNKQIAAELGISEFTVKVHRGSLMRKLKARSVPELVRMADVLGLDRAGGEPPIAASVPSL